MIYVNQTMKARVNAVKIKDIAPILKKHNNIYFYQQADTVYLANGYVAYAVYGLPKMTDEHVLTILDVPGTDRDVVFASISPRVKNLFESEDYQEAQLERSPLLIEYLGTTYEPVIGTKGLLLINVKYLKPFNALSEGYTLYEAYNPEDNDIIIRVKAGMITVGIISPSNNVITDNFVEQIFDIRNSADKMFKWLNYQRLNEDITFDDIEDKEDEND